MSALDWVVAVWALALIVPLICRMDPIGYREHRAWVVVFHIAMISTCWGAWYATVTRGAFVLSIAALTCISAWLIGSYSTWKRGVPSYLAKGPVEHHARRATDRPDAVLARNGEAT
jgi:hypothetical protein